jgi:outer membrane lipoprotein-sorting protein
MRPDVSRRRFLGLFGVAAGAAIAPRIAHAGDSPEEILRHADDVRNPAESYFVRCIVKSSSASDDTEVEVSIQGNARTLMKTVRPARDRGRLGLMVDEDMWAYIPNLGRSVRISLAQRLVGQAANGDIARCRWSGDYAPTIEAETPQAWTLLLTATKKGLTYEKIRAWIEKGSYHPLHAEFLTPAGKPLKRAEYRAYKALAGKDRPTVTHIEDAIRSGDYSDIQILEMTPRAFPASLFYPENLK